MRAGEAGTYSTDSRAPRAGRTRVRARASERRRRAGGRVPRARRQHRRKRLAGRAGDGRRDNADAEVIEHRLKLFHDNMRPILDYYGERGILVTVDAAEPVERVTEEILGGLRAAFKGSVS